MPSLARSCDPSADGLTITCHLIEATFQNGDPVTADDVVFTYRLMSADTPVRVASPDCVTDVWTETLCLSEVLESAAKVDDRTVAFRPETAVRPVLTRTSCRRLDRFGARRPRAYATLRTKLETVPAADLAASATGAGGEQPADCRPLLPDAAQLAARAGLFVPDRAEYNYLPRAKFDACAYAQQPQRRARTGLSFQPRRRMR